MGWRESGEGRGVREAEEPLALQQAMENKDFEHGFLRKDSIAAWG